MTEPSEWRPRRKGPRLDILPRVTSEDLRDVVTHVPEDLRRRRIWVCCDRTPIERGYKDHKRTVSSKIPIWTGGNASSTNPKTWMSFEEALAMAQSDDRVACLGICVHEQDLVVVDYDHVLRYDANAGSVTALEAFERFLRKMPATYTEVSPGRDGVHQVYLGGLPDGWKKQATDLFGEGAHLECYDRGRYLTITGSVLTGANKLGTIRPDDPPAVLIEALRRPEKSTPARSREPAGTPSQGESVTARYPVTGGNGNEPVEQRSWDAELFKRALWAIDPDCHYEDTYFPVMAACLQCLGEVDGKAEFIEWSLQAAHRFDEAALEASWASLERNEREDRPGFQTVAELAEKENPLWRAQPLLDTPLDMDEAERIIAEAQAARKVHVAAAEPQGDEQQPAQPKLYLQAAESRALAGQAEFLVYNLVPRYGLIQFFGKPGAGKSLVCMSLAFAIATGEARWMAHDVDLHGPVVWIVGEDTAGVSARFIAECAIRGLDPNSVPILISQAPTELMRAGAVSEHGNAMIAELHAKGWGPPAMITIDTFATNFGPGSEDSTEDMSIAMTHAAALQRSLRCLVAFVHHSGHANDSRGRGNSAFLAALDAEFRVVQKEGGAEDTRRTPADVAFGVREAPEEPFERTGNLVRVEPQKVRNWARQPPLETEIVAVEIGTLERSGRPETAACVVHYAREPLAEDDLSVLPEGKASAVEALLAFLDRRSDERISRRRLREVDVTGTSRKDRDELIDRMVDTWEFLQLTGTGPRRCLEMSDRGRKWLVDRLL